MGASIIVASASLLAKALKAGLAFWHAKDDQFSEEDVTAISAALETVTAAAALVPKATPKPLRARHAAMVVSAFGEAWKEHWVNNAHFAPNPDMPHWLDHLIPKSKTRLRAQEAAWRIQHALETVDQFTAPSNSDPAHNVDTSPLNNPLYRSLWATFTAPHLDEGLDQPLIHDAVRAKHEFEQSFLVAYATLSSSAPGQELRQLLLAGSSARRAELHRILIEDMSSWRTRHIFGNVTKHTHLPDMPLQAMYVEPFALRYFPRKDDATNRALPVLSLLQESLAANSLVIVAADFGFGKSLTARMLASILARRHLTSSDPTSSLPFPIYVRCADDFTGHKTDIDQIVRRALLRHARELRLDLQFKDPVLEPPSSEQATTFIFDGLDEVALNERELETFFQGLEGMFTQQHRFVIFSRPAALPHDAKLDSFPKLQLQPFTGPSAERRGNPAATHSSDQAELQESPSPSQIELWLSRWSQTTGQIISIADIKKRGLIEISSTPILLFMIAHSWKHLEDGDNAVSLADLYDTFLSQLARGKHDDDLQRHPRVLEAAENIRKLLLTRGEIGPETSIAEATLWLMSRVAWEFRTLSQRGEHLTNYSVERIIREELGGKDAGDFIHCIKIGILLVMQADLEGSSHRILFGHKSFNEFLAAKYWFYRLRKIAISNHTEWDEISKTMYGANLCTRVGDDRTLAFLNELVARLTEGERVRVADWASTYFNADIFSVASREQRELREQLRAAALAIGSRLNELGTEPLTARRPDTLRSIVGAFFVANDTVRIVAKGLIHKDADLEGLDLNEADFSHATLTHSDLAKSSMFAASLAGADLTECNLAGTSLHSVKATDASFVRAKFAQASAIHSAFPGSDFSSASFRFCQFAQTDFSHSIFTDANILNCQFYGCSFAGADFSAATMTGCTFSNCDFTASRIAKGQLARCRSIRSSGLSESLFEPTWLEQSLPPRLMLFEDDEDEDEGYS
jgi:uncharacterized protein YjbI with pentapeptide repeats